MSLLSVSRSAALAGVLLQSSINFLYFSIQSLMTPTSTLRLFAPGVTAAWLPALLGVGVRVGCVGDGVALGDEAGFEVAVAEVAALGFVSGFAVANVVATCGVADGSAPVSDGDSVLYP